MSETVTVNITCTEVVEYSQEVEMDKETYEEYQMMVDSDNFDESRLEDIADAYIDRREVLDGKGLEEVEFELMSD